MSDFEQETKLHGAFAAFRAESMNDVSPAGTDAVRATVRHQRKVRNIALGVLALVATAVPVAAYATLAGDPNGPPPALPGATAPVTPTEAPRPTPSGSITPSAVIGALLNAKIDIPTWSGGDRITQYCPAGSYTFATGSAVFEKSASYDGTYRISGNPVDVELDGEPGAEVIMDVTCSGPASFYPEQLLALKPLPGGGFRTLGWVMPPSGGEINYYRDWSVKVVDRVVHLEVLGNYRTNGWYANKQQRSYKYDGGAFKQVGGPTSYPTLPASIRDVDLRNSTLQLKDFSTCGTSCGLALVNFVDGRGSDVVEHFAAGRSLVLYEFTVDNVLLVGPRDQEHALIRVTSKDPNGVIHRVVLDVTFRQTGPNERGLVAEVTVLQNGKDGVTDILSVKAGSRTYAVEVTVRTSAGQEARTYEWGVTGSTTWSRQ